MTGKVEIHRLQTGVPGLDAILGGGLPELSFNLITGPPGSGKTTFAQQLMFALATPERPGVFFTAMGESPMKMLRYQQQFSFFQLDQVGGSVRFCDLSEEVATGQLDRVLARITAEVAASSPALVFVDSFRAMTRAAHVGGTTADDFIQRLGSLLSGWQATTFLVGEFSSQGEPHPVLTVADGILSLEQEVQRNSMVRKIQILKMRGQPISPGPHTFRITAAGLQIFASAKLGDPLPGMGSAQAGRSSRSSARLALGVAGLDQMLGGGLPVGYSALIVGPSGSGKTVLATAFLAEGARQGEPGVLIAFEQTPSQSLNRTLDALVSAGQLSLINTRSMDLSIDEIVQELVGVIARTGAKRVVIDSLSGFELAVAPTFREDFRESLFRMIAALSGRGVTLLMTSELEDRYTDLRFSPYGTAFLTDAIIVQRYVELDGHLERVLAVVKVRDSSHSTEIRKFQITGEGIVLGEAMSGFEGLMVGHPTRSVEGRRP